MWKAVFVVAGAVVGYVGPILGGAAFEYAMELVASWPGRSGPVGGHSGAASWTRLIGVPLGVLVFSLLGFWLGSRMEERAGRDEASQKWQAVFAVFGALVGYVTGWFGPLLVFSALGLRGAADSIALFVGIPLAGAAFSLLGLQLGSALEGRQQRSAFPQTWETVSATLGAAIGPVIGFYCVFYLAYASIGGDCWRGFGAFFAGLLHGAPIGGILCCLLGFCLGSALDERSRRNHLNERSRKTNGPEQKDAHRG